LLGALAGDAFKEAIMEVVHQCAAGLDVHKDTVVACVRTMANGKAQRECRTFGTTTEELEALRDWLTSCGCAVAAMEATGSTGCRSGRS
jgi:transposase